jgi:hypothetical protein
MKKNECVFFVVLYQYISSPFANDLSIVHCCKKSVYLITKVFYNKRTLLNLNVHLLPFKSLNFIPCSSYLFQQFIDTWDKLKLTETSHYMYTGKTECFWNGNMNQ